MSVEKNEDIVTDAQAEEKVNVEQSAPEVKAEVVKEKSSDIDKDDAMVKKLVFSLCYLWGIFFFLPLLMYKGDAKALRYANDGLILLLLTVIGDVILGALSAITWIFGMLAGIYSLVLFLIGIIGIVYVVTDQDKELPIISKIRILK